MKFAFHLLRLPDKKKERCEQYLKSAWLFVREIAFLQPPHGVDIRF